MKFVILILCIFSAGVYSDTNIDSKKFNSLNKFIKKNLSGYVQAKVDSVKLSNFDGLLSQLSTSYNILKFKNQEIYTIKSDQSYHYLDGSLLIAINVTVYPKTVEKRKALLKENKNEIQKLRNLFLSKYFIFDVKEVKKIEHIKSLAVTVSSKNSSTYIKDFYIVARPDPKNLSVHYKINARVNATHILVDQLRSTLTNMIDSIVADTKPDNLEKEQISQLGSKIVKKLCKTELNCEHRKAAK
ncbi:MAG: hypothetical protein HOE90_24435 [Bacteriovoracaceae bacterium]|jgi:hypothetical protein|nr:hypothetical protein [Bacteriovoracaceae bacterium]